jgi:Pseudouridylate synthases, 23S RNA-specific
MSKEVSHTVTLAENGLRLDIFLARVAGYGVRTAKRLAGDGHVTVDGKPRPAHFKLTAGAIVEVREPSAPLADAPIVTVAVTDGYIAFAKPPGLHTAAIAGLATPSLEEALAGQWSAIRAELPGTPPTQLFSGALHSGSSLIPALLAPFLGGVAQEAIHVSFSQTLPPTPPELLSRLDAETSGLVLAALSPHAAERFRKMEASGETQKYYLAVVHGTVSEPFAVRNALDTDNRKKTRALPEETTDTTRHSAVFPIGNAREHVPGAQENTTLVAVRIQRGARHQIRAHLAHAGYPILGDALYGTGKTGATMYLHHARLVFPGFEAFRLPPWLLI